MCWAQTQAQYGSDRSSWGIPTLASCPVPEMTSLPPSYQCLTGSSFVEYTFVCDHRQDCSDNSDESFCSFPPCQGHTPQQCRGSKQVEPRFCVVSML
ncbi:hypothetical protein ACOMHN_023785 [Nucella lapillus]